MKCSRDILDGFGPERVDAPLHMRKIRELIRLKYEARLSHEQIAGALAISIRRILSSRPDPEQGYRACLGLLRLERQDGAVRLEAACARALLVLARRVVV